MRDPSNFMIPSVILRMRQVSSSERNPCARGENFILGDGKVDRSDAGGRRADSLNKAGRSPLHRQTIGAGLQVRNHPIETVGAEGALVKRDEAPVRGVDG